MPSGKNAPSGTKAVKYSGPEDGPFRCDHCPHFVNEFNTCDHPEVIHDPEMQTVRIDGKNYAKVKAGGCCEYYRPVSNLKDIPWPSVGL